MRYSIVHHDVREEFGLTVSQYLVCDSIHQLSHGGPVNRTDKDIADFLGLDRSHVGHTRKILIGKGLVLETLEGQTTSELWSNAVTYKRGKSPRGENPAQSGENPRSHLLYKEIKNIAEADAPQVVKVYEEEEKSQKRESRSKDKLAVFALFSPKEEPWWRFKQEKESAISLFDLEGVDKVKQGIRYMRENQDDPYCPQANTPNEYAQKLAKLKAYVKRTR